MLKIKNSCGCGHSGENLTDKVKNNFTLYVIQQSNKYGDRAIYEKNGTVGDLSIKAITNENVLTVVKKGTKSIKEVIW